MNKIPRSMPDGGAESHAQNKMPVDPNPPLADVPYKTPSTTGYEGDSPSGYGK